MLALSLDEMKAVQAHFRELGRDPTDCELETIAQTWSEHCSHKTLKGTITLTDKTTGETRTYREPAQGNRLRGDADDPSEARGRRLVRQRLRGQRRRRAVRRTLPPLLQGRNAQPPLRDRALRRRQHGSRRRHPRSPRHRPGRQARLQHRRLLLRPARLPAGSTAAGRAPSAPGHAGRRRGRARLRQPHGHPHRQRRHRLRRALPRQPAGLLRHRRTHPARDWKRKRRGPAT